MKEFFIAKDFRPAALATIDQANAIIAEYQEQDLRLTLRQLYYQFVSRDFIFNTQKSYKHLAKVVSDGRLAGLIDWAAIEDRGRVPRVPSFYDSMNELVQVIRNAAEQYTLDRWEGQETYVELWVEKEALAGVLAPVGDKFQIPLVVNKGYSSSSAMYANANRIISRQELARGEEDRSVVILYLGDHDPSGEDMVRDIEERLTLFGVRHLEVQKVALTSAQVRQYKPPPNPAKLTDPRAKAYIAEHGRSSWELDALEPRVLAQLATRAVAQHISKPVLELVLEREASDRKMLEKRLKGL